MAKVVSPDVLEAFSKPLLQRSSCFQQIQFIDRLLGESEATAASIANEMIKDLESATHYPPEIKVEPDKQKILKAINDLVESLNAMKTKGD